MVADKSPQDVFASAEVRRKGKSARKNKGVRRRGAQPTSLIEISNGEKITLEHALDRGVALQVEGRVADAAKIFSAILSIYPRQADALNLLGLLYFSSGRHADAADFIRKAVKSDPANQFAWCNFGTVLHAIGDLDGAIASTKRALKLDPNYVQARNNLGNQLMDDGQVDLAIEAFEQALSVRQDLPDVHNNLALAMIELGRVADAVKVAERAVTIHPEFAPLRVTLGTALGMFGRLDDAVESFHRAVEIQPDLGEAYWGLSRIKKFTSGDNDLQAMQNLFELDVLLDENRMQVGFGLGKAYEDVGEFEAAIECYKQANAIKRRFVDFGIPNVETQFAKIKSQFNEEFFTRHAGAGLPDATPIFIVGMPRSGTTLIEQVLSAHPQVFGAGEVTALADAIRGEFGALRYGFFEILNEDKFDNKIRNAAKSYLTMLPDGDGAARITDKMPHNFELIGAIRHMFPNARVIHCTRNAFDNCLSLFKSQFSANGYRYIYDSKEIALYYNLYRDLMAHWQKVLPDFILDIDYQAFVENQRSVTERLLTYCRLPWDDACMMFHKNDRSVTTASFAQVRKPLYTTSIGVGENYRSHLGEMFDILEAKPAPST